MLLDVLTTIYALDAGIAHEANNNMVSVVNNIPLFFLVKTAGIIVVLYLLRWIDSGCIRLGDVTRYILGSMMFFVVINNFIVIIKGLWL